jgi:hypothetical protein
MNYTEKLTKQLKEKGLKKTWLAKELMIHYENFWVKMKDNSFTKEEKEKINILIGEDSPEKTSILKHNNDARTLRRLAKSFTI